MPNVVALNAQNTKSADGKSFTGNAKKFPISESIANVIRRLWPKKTAQHVSFVTGCDERTVKFWLAGETRMSVESVSKLLATDDGFEILAAIMGEAKPQWWVAVQMAQELRRSRSELKRQERRREALRAQYSLLDDQ
jgi:hypothetical protein